MEDEENSSLNVEYNGQVYELSNLSKEFAAYLSENNEYLKDYMDQIVSKSFSKARKVPSAGDSGKIYCDIEDVDGKESTTSASSANFDTQGTISKTTPKTKRKYTSYRKLDDESEQNTFDEALVSLIMDKPELYNIKLDTSKKNREKVALAWIDIQNTLNTDYSHVDYSIDELKGRWTSLKSAHIQRKKKKKSGDGASFDPVTAKLDMLMAGLCDLNLVKETQSNLPKRNVSANKAATSSERDIAEGDYLNSFFNDDNAPTEDQPTPPGTFKKVSKSNELGEKFLKCFNDLKTDFLKRNDQSQASPPTSNDNKINPKIDRFCAYISTCLQGFSEDDLEDVQLDIMNVIVKKKRQHRSQSHS